MRSLIRIIIVVVAFAGLGILLLDRLIMPAYVAHDQERYLPDVRGLSFEEARDRLALEGFDALKGDVKFTDSQPPGTVIDQYPRVGRSVKPGRRVRLTVAERERMVVVPDLVGKSMRSARLEITESGLRIDSLITEYDVEVPRDVIKWQYPRAGDHLRRGSGLTLIISQGKPPDFYQVPQLFGLSLAQAETLLDEAQLEVGRITYRQNEDLVPYTVLDQSVEAGTIVDHPIAVNLTVSIINLDDVYKNLTTPR
ncbi:MAG: PASTA domain-containing protein [Fidelibacterota bacterium]